MSSSPFMIPATNLAGFNGAFGSGTPTTMSAGNFNFGNSANPNPAMAPTTVNPYAPATNTAAPPAAAPTQNPTGSPSPTNPSTAPPPSNGMNTQQQSVYAPQQSTGLFGETTQQQEVTNQSLDATFGSGIGTELAEYLNSEGGFNSSLTTQTVDAQTAAMQQQIQQGLGNLQTNLSESGISPNSSVSALEQSNYMSNATTQENAITATDFFNMWNQSQSNELNAIDLTGGAGAAKKTGQTLSLSSLFGGLLGAAESGGQDYVNY